MNDQRQFAIPGGVLSLAAIIAAVFFFLLAALSVTLGDVPLVPAGLVSLAASLALQRFGL